MSTSHPYPGVSVHTNKFGMKIVKLHYDADPDKGLGPKTFVPDIKLNLSPWALAEYNKMTDKALYRQEYEVDFAATEGQLIYIMDPEATLEDSFPIPENWTRYYALDPHPRVPHASLWCAVDPWGDRWYYREYWPSKVYGEPGNIPEDDNRVRIKDYCEVVQWLESADNPENSVDGKGDKSFDEKIYKRVIDYAARSFGKGTTDDPEQPNFQVRFEQAADEISEKVDKRFVMQFEDAKKDHDAGEDQVNQGLKSFEVEQNDGTFKKKARIHIFRDRCPELCLQLRTVRRPKLSAIQAETMDPKGGQVNKRNHMTDTLRYVEMANPLYVQPQQAVSTFRPITKGVAY